MRLSKGLAAAVAIGVGVAVTASAFPTSNHAQAARPLAISGKVGFLISDYTTSPRWVTDRDVFISTLHKLDPGVTVSVQDAKTNQTTQQNEAQALLTQHAKVLVVVAVEGTQAGAIVRLAHSNSPKVPVIAYDRLILKAPVDAYTSFDNFKVGVKQAQYLVKHVKKGGTIVSIAGDTGDNNAHLFHAGAMSVLQPLVNKHYFKLAYDQYTPNWSATNAQSEMAAALNRAGNKVDGVLCANDTMAGGVIAALRSQHLAGKIPVTGQDASVAGLQQILLGNQGMTIYKPLKKEDLAAAQMTDAFLHGRKFTSKTMTNNGSVNVPSIIIPVITVTKANIKQTVIKDGFVTKAALCHGIPASACRGL